MKIAKDCICCGSKNLRKTPAVLAPFVADRIFGWSPVEITPEWGLRDIQPGVAQAICASVACDECGVMFLDMRFDDDELGRLYADYRGAQYTSLREQYEPGYGKRNEALLEKPAYIPIVEKILHSHVAASPVVLDWGGDIGLNTPFASVASRHDVYDISGKIPVGRARQVDASCMASDYDLIVCSQVLEHVANPRGLIHEIAAVMTTNTRLYLEVPYEALIQRLESGEVEVGPKRHWHEHINFFTPKSLEVMVSLVGLKVIEIGQLPLLVGETHSVGLYLIASLS